MRRHDFRWLARVASCLLVLIAATKLAHVSAQAKPDLTTRPGDALIGEWWTEGNEGRVKFARYRDGTFRGITTCCVPTVETADHLIKDKNNPNPKLRDRSTVGIVIIWKLIYEDGAYSGGYVYNPRDGGTYRMDVKMIDHDTVKIRGYIGLSIFGQSQIWKRASSAATPPH